MLAKYVWADLVRNPRRTLSTVAGVTLGIGLTCAVLFFVDGLSASMTQRSVASLTIDMQRVLTAPVGGDLALAERLAPTGRLAGGDLVTVHLEITNRGVQPAHEVSIRSLPPTRVGYVAGSAKVDGNPFGDRAENPLARGPASEGLNLGTVPAGVTRSITYQGRATADVDLAGAAFRSSVSSREALTPVRANSSSRVDLADLAHEIASVGGVAFAEPLSFVDLPAGTLGAPGRSVTGPARVFGFGPAYAAHDKTISMLAGSSRVGSAMVSAEVAAALGIGIGDAVSLRLPDGARFDVNVSGVLDLTRARALFSSRRGGDLEAFLYVPNSVVLDPATFEKTVLPAFERAAADRSQGRLKSPPVREIDIGVERGRLNADPGTALVETQAIASAVSTHGDQLDYVIDNISNSLAVARADSSVAKRMFIFLGLPGGLLAAVLAAYAGNVLAAAQRREQATLRIRGASRRHLLRMLAIRVAGITVSGAIVGVAIGYGSATAVLGPDALARASTTSLVVSGIIGTFSGLIATAAALYVTGRRSIEREINEDRARLVARPPVWRRLRLDLLGVVAVGAASVAAVATSAFKGSAGSVYVGRAVQLPLPLLALPIGAWVAGCLLGARAVAALVGKHGGRSATKAFRRPLRALYRRSVGRRSWAIADGVVVVALIVALGTSLGMFTASYDQAKARDSRYTAGSDLRITPRPGGDRTYGISDAHLFQGGGVAAATPVVYGAHNAIVRSDRTSDVANLAAVDPRGLQEIAPLDDASFVDTRSATAALARLGSDPPAVLLSNQFADFLRAKVGDNLELVLARGTDQQVTVHLTLAGRFDRLPGFPDGAQALMDLKQYEAAVKPAVPDFFLARTEDGSPASLQRAVSSLGKLPALQVDTRETVLAKDQSSLAALNIRGLVDLDSGYGLAMGIVAIGVFVFGLLLQRRREYVTLRAQGMHQRTIRALIVAEASTVAVAGCAIGVVVGAVMAAYFVSVLRPLFILKPTLAVPVGLLATDVASVLIATLLASLAGTALVSRLRATELLRDE